MIRFSEATAAAIQVYYNNCNRKEAGYVWDKDADLNRIFAAENAQGDITHCSASAGTFWFTWNEDCIEGENDLMSQPVTTTHSEEDWKEMLTWDEWRARYWGEAYSRS